MTVPRETFPTSPTPPDIWLRTICRKNGLSPDDRQLRQLTQYVDLLVEWNTKINLVSRADISNVWPNHILHSILLLFKASLAPGSRVLDLGTGGGLPGIPLAILLPSVKMTLLDATRKKAEVVTSMVQSLGLVNVTVQWGRAEEFVHKPEFVGGFDYVIARAVAPLSDLAKWSKPLLTDTPRLQVANNEFKPPALLALKGGDLEAEVRNAQANKSVHSIDVINLVFDGSDQIQATDKKLAVVHFR